MNKQKPMTQREKKERAQMRKELIAEGVLPPPKKPLNRKKYIRDAMEAWNANGMEAIEEWAYLIQAIGLAMSTYKPKLEDVGVAKMLNVAMEIARFEAECKAAGQTRYKVDALYARIKPILDA